MNFKNDVYFLIAIFSIQFFVGLFYQMPIQVSSFFIFIFIILYTWHKINKVYMIIKAKSENMSDSENCSEKSDKEKDINFNDIQNSSTNQ